MSVLVIFMFYIVNLMPVLQGLLLALEISHEGSDATSHRSSAAVETRPLVVVRVLSFLRRFDAVILSRTSVGR